MFGKEAAMFVFSATGIPIGLLASAKFDSFVVDNSDITEKVTTFGWGLAYAGRDDFSLSLETSRLRVPLIQSDRTINANLVAFISSISFRGKSPSVMVGPFSTP